MKILHNDEKVLYMGRRDVTDSETRLYYAGSQAIVKFRGTCLSVTFNSTAFWGRLQLGTVIDGQMSGVPLVYENNGRDVTVTVAENLTDGEHTAVIY